MSIKLEKITEASIDKKNEVMRFTGNKYERFWRARGETGYWEVLVRRNLNDNEVEEYLKLLEELQCKKVVDSKSDEIIWSPKPGDGFSVKGGYSWVRRGRPGSPTLARMYKEVRECKIPLKVKAFLWNLFQERILTKSRLARWDPMMDVRCVLCGETEETATHLFILCPLVKQVWRWLAVAGGVGCPSGTLEELWLEGKGLCATGDRSVRAKFTQIFVPAALWSIWLIRNHCVFQGSIPYAENIRESIVRLVTDWGIFCVGAKSACLVNGVFMVHE
ncbi:hypothetical protein QJS10_CPB04g01543 [Acorus calamus]|uniref:Reverse transcriptase zinc-binding domain-containing protein n=1 Tax=Acorus calamus TaxID=4465 RepID=A0AAV9EZ09_ACOCL|nr:hypothetical protein QJS10_CPB04g01543 [Acorus calamus]